MSNPELTHWTGPQGLPRFDRIADADIMPAVEAALSASAARWEAIAANPAPADFTNTIAAMEVADADLDRVLAVFSVLAGNVSTPAREAIERDLAPLLAAHSARIMTDARLLARTEAVWAGADALPPEDRRVTELARRGLLRGGAGLDAAGRARIAAIGARMAVLTTQFSQNLLADEREAGIAVPPAVLDALPGWLAGALRAAGQTREAEGAVLPITRSLLVPFLEHCPDRALRAKAQAAWEARGDGSLSTGGDNRPLIAEILALRHERAQLLGHEDYAAFKLAPEMAGEAARVEALLGEVWAAARARAEADEAALGRLAAEDGLNDGIQPWDWRFYAARRRAAEHALDEDAIKPHFTLEAMIAAAFDVAGRLFGLTFQPFEAPLWHPDVRAWTVSRGGQPMAVLLGDFLARPGKRSGAWCGRLQPQHKMAGGQRAIITNSCNFAPPAEAGAPVLLGWDDARTLFHEFGHALHHMLSDVHWPSIAGTSVARDFVELPSQLYEHWLTVPEVLDRHARHVETGAALPAALRDRLIAADTADSGFATVEYLESALVDLALHRGAPPADPLARQAEVLAALGAPRAIPPRMAAPHFQHIFAGDGYASGYYSYMWSEVMDADAFAAFEEAGDAFDPETARRLEAEILSRGGSAPPEALWTAFRERMPGVGPLLKGRGLDAAPQPERAD